MGKDKTTSNNDENEEKFIIGIVMSVQDHFGVEALPAEPSSVVKDYISDADASRLMGVLVETLAAMRKNQRGTK